MSHLADPDDLARYGSTPTTTRVEPCEHCPGGLMRRTPDGWVHDHSRDAERARVAAAVADLRAEDAEHQTVTLDLLNDPGRAFVLSEYALADLTGRRVPLTDGGDNRLGDAVVTGAEQTDDGLHVTMAVRVYPGAPAGYLDALRRDTACEFSAVSWGPDLDRHGKVRHVTLRRAWPGPGLPAMPRTAGQIAAASEPGLIDPAKIADARPFDARTVACSACPRVVPDASPTEVESGLCLRCLNGGPPAAPTVDDFVRATAAAVGLDGDAVLAHLDAHPIPTAAPGPADRVRALLEGRPRHALMSVGRILDALDNTPTKEHP